MRKYWKESYMKWKGMGWHEVKQKDRVDIMWPRFGSTF